MRLHRWRSTKSKLIFFQLNRNHFLNPQFLTFCDIFHQKLNLLLFVFAFLTFHKYRPISSAKEIVSHPRRLGRCWLIHFIITIWVWTCESLYFESVIHISSVWNHANHTIFHFIFWIDSRKKRACCKTKEMTSLLPWKLCRNKRYVYFFQILILAILYLFIKFRLPLFLASCREE